MNILLHCDDLMTRVRLESRFKSAGARLLKPADSVVPELILVDLTARDALAMIGRLQQDHPSSRIIAFGPHVEGEIFKAARQAGAHELVARGKVIERVIAKLSTAAAHE